MSDEFYPQLWDTVEYEGDPYAIPFNTDTQVIFYNKQIFKEAGISEDQLPQTWDELETVAHKLDVKKGDSFGAYRILSFVEPWRGCLGIER